MGPTAPDDFFWRLVVYLGGLGITRHNTLARSACMFNSGFMAELIADLINKLGLKYEVKLRQVPSGLGGVVEKMVCTLS